MFKKTFSSLIVAASLWALAAPASAQQMNCLDSNAATAALQQNPGLLNISAAASRAGIGGQIVSPSFCNMGGTFVWAFSSVGADGVVRRYVVNAANGAVISGG